MFNEKELKLLALLLDSSAQEGEVANAYAALIKSLRARGASVEDFKHNGSAPPKLSKPDYGVCRFDNWGPHGGDMLVDIPPDYLEEVVLSIESGGIEQTSQNKQLVARIKKYLAQH